jgi:hypothetical protein
MSALQLTAFQKNCVELLASVPQCHSRACFRSALHHLDRARALEDIDPAMAVFRGITAEEEAASGVMHALRECQYRGTNRLKPRNHLHKHAVYPFLRVVGLFHGQLFQLNLKEYRLHIKDEEGERRLMLAFPLPFTVADEKQWAYPIPPLNFGLTVQGTAKPPNYEKQIAAFVESVGAKDIVAYLKNEANRRNRVLYASPQGYPVVSKLEPEYLAEKTNHVLALLQAYLLIKPWRELQPYVQDCMGAFLVMVGEMESYAELTDEG